MTERNTIEFIVSDTEIGARLDALVAAKMPQFSRTVIRRSVTGGEVTVDGKTRKPSYRLQPGERVCVCVRETNSPGPEPEDIPLDILFEDDALAVINKPSGMVVHPAKGHWAGTLTSALAFHFKSLSGVGGPQRPGIVHRLDRDTSGVIVVAKHDRAHLELARQFENRTVQKEYFAVCRGTQDRDSDWIRLPIGVHPYQREKMAVRGKHATSREAETFFQVDQRWQAYLTLRVFPKTGRTHQIRVHLTHIGCPILCDPLYSGHRLLTATDVAQATGKSAPATVSANEQESESVLLDRLALHARRLKIRHPQSHELLEFEAPIPEPLIRVTEFFSR